MDNKLKENEGQRVAREKFEAAQKLMYQAAAEYLEQLAPTWEEREEAAEMLTEQFRESIADPEFWSDDLMVEQIAEARRWRLEEEAQ